MTLPPEVAAALVHTRRDTNEPPVVVFSANAPAGKVLGGLLVWFDGQDRHSQVAVVVDGDHRGYLDRDWVLRSSEPVIKGFGGGDHAILPGDLFFEEERLHCPTEGCPYHLWVVCYDPTDHLKCKRHDTVLVVDEK